MDNQRKLLLKLHAVKYATLYNLFSRDAKSFRGSLLNTDKIIKSILPNKWIKKIIPEELTKDRKRHIFYSLTKKGTKHISEDHKYTEIKSVNNMYHEQAKIDIAISFLDYGEYDIELDYNANLNGLKPDIVVTLKGEKTYTFLVEIERKRSAARTFNERLKRYEQMFKKNELKKLNLDKNTKVLVVYANSQYDTYWRPIQFTEKYLSDIIKLQERQLKGLLDLAKDLPNRYLFITLDKFNRIQEPIWYNNKGQKVKLINN